VSVLIGIVSRAAATTILLSLIFGGCSKPKANSKDDAALQTALDELTRLNSYTETGLDYSQYSDRLLTAKANIDVALGRTTDARAKEEIEQAVRWYVQARNEWRKQTEDKSYSGLGVQYYLKQGSAASARAAEYANANDATRSQLETQWRAEEENAEKQRQARAIAEQQRRDTERQRAAEAAELERKRRFAPDGTVYNLKLITVRLDDGLTSIPPGTELKVTRKNSDGTLHVEKGGLAADVPATDVTNDRDLAAAVRSDDKARQEALRRWSTRRGSRRSAH
jgi:hypothetical protein